MECYGTPTMKLQDRVAVVTGAGGYLGCGIALRLAAEGARIAVNDRSLEEASKTLDLIIAQGGQALACVVDVTKTSEVNEMISQVKKKWGRIDILVNNAGGPRDALLVKMTDEDWDFVVDLNLKGSFICARAVAPHMIEQGGGRIINISSTAYTGKNVGQVNYASAKAGVVGLTRALGLELARYAITVNCVAPGLIDTPKTRAYQKKIADRLIEAIPMRRMGDIADIANAVLFFVTDEAKYITRQVLHVSGGVVDL
jgi:NAD(P)-dependent dehydrogenase (short-subunit alcohol dehydrogenase family)